MTNRTVFFIDYSNAFNAAAEEFCGLAKGAASWGEVDGHFSPGDLAVEAVTALNASPKRLDLELTQVRVYAGIPAGHVSAHEAKKKSGEEGRTERWESCQRVEVKVHRPPLSYGEDSVSETGVDTQLAADLISMAYDHCFDVAVLVSRDNDFIPVLEEVERLKRSGTPVRVDLAGWAPTDKKGPGKKRRKKRPAAIALPRGLRDVVQKHRLTEAMFKRVADDHRRWRPQGGPRQRQKHKRSQRRPSDKVAGAEGVGNVGEAWLRAQEPRE